MKPKYKLLSFSTTIRNPERYIEFLRCAQKFHGFSYNDQLLIKFEKELISRGIYRPTKRDRVIEEKWDKGEKLSHSDIEKILVDNPQNYGEGWIGRAKTHLMPLKELALVRVKEEKFFITEIGLKLLQKNLDINEFYTKLLLKIQFGNPFRRDVKNKANPFLVILSIINQVNEIWEKEGKKPVGISRTEFEYFVLPMVNNNYNSLVDEIITYRKKFGLLQVKEEYLTTSLFIKVGKQKVSTIKDYSDNVIRHLRYTGLVSFRGSAKFIDISEGFVEITKEILSKFKLEWKNFTTEDDYINSLLRDIKLEWKVKRENQRNALWNFIKDNKITLEDANEELKYLGENSNKGIRKTFLKKFSSEEIKSWWIWKIKPPLKLEVLLAILFILKFDNIGVNPKFLVDDEGLPYFTAPAGEVDIIVTCDDVTTVLVEATLLRDKKGQLINETGSIGIRSSKFKNKIKKDSITYTILVAPFVHPVAYRIFKTWVHEPEIFSSQRCHVFALSIKKFLDSFINTELRELKKIVEKKFSEFKKATMSELNDIVN